MLNDDQWDIKAVIEPVKQDLQSVESPSRGTDHDGFISFLVCQIQRVIIDTF